MKILLVVVFVLSLAAARAFAGEPDCVYEGRGEVYDFNGSHLAGQSFSLKLERRRIGPGQYSFQETKTFPNGSKANLTFGMGWFVGNFLVESGEGRLTKGRCIDYGYCVGKNEFPGFKGTFVTRFNSREMLTTTTTESLIVDERVYPTSGGDCPFSHR